MSGPTFAVVQNERVARDVCGTKVHELLDALAARHEMQPWRAPRKPSSALMLFQ